jgi:monoamine oxidase
VIVIGAGVAGLGCARALTDRGYEVAVLEARTRVGGRIYSLRLPADRTVELGAQVIVGDRALTWEVVREAGLRVAPYEPARELVFAIDGRPVHPKTLLEAGVTPPWVVAEIVTRPGVPDVSARQALEVLDHDGVGRAIALEWMAQLWGADPSDISVAGIARRRQSNRAGTGEYVVLDGYDRVAEWLARELDIRLAAPVQEVRWGSGEVEALVEETSVIGRAAVVTVPPPVVVDGHLRFDPQLPEEKLDAGSRLLPGDAVVVAVLIEEAAQRSSWGLSVGGPGGLWRAVAGSRVVTGSFKGRGARLSSELGGEALTALAAPVLPSLARASVQEIHTVDWSVDPYAGGGLSFPRVGALDVPAAWGAPLADTLFFAGDATCGADESALVDGALATGARVAQDVAQALASGHT